VDIIDTAELADELEEIASRLDRPTYYVGGPATVSALMTAARIVRAKAA